MKTIDTCGMSCPQPLLMTKNALKQSSDGLDIITDSNNSKTTIHRYLENEGYTVTIEEANDTFVLKARK